MPLKFNVGDTVRVEGDNDVWDGTIAVIDYLTGDPEYPYSIRVKSSPRAHTAGAEFLWNEETLVLNDSAREKLDRIIAERFPRRTDVYYSPLTGGAAILDPDGLHRILADGTVDTEVL